MGRQPNLTRILNEFNAVDTSALERLLPLVYEELKSIANHYFAKERNAQSLQPTLLVHDAYVKLLGTTPGSFESRAHFFSIAARAMRQVLINHARDRRRLNRGGEHHRITLVEGPSQNDAQSVDTLDFEDALFALEQENPNQAKMIELRFFGGLSINEIATIMNVSVSTVERGLRFARAFLATRLEHPDR